MSGHEDRLVFDDHMNPDCRDDKHRACAGDAWCYAEDEASRCECPCHVPTSIHSETGADRG